MGTNPGKTQTVGQNVTGNNASTPIYNDLSGADLSVTQLVDPVTVRLYREAIANQMNTQRQAQSPPKVCLDLSEFIADVIVETTVQGAGMLEVHIIDPYWVLLTTDKNGVAYFDVDEGGYLWPPIDLNFPPDVSDAQWRLCALRPSTDMTQPNIILTFEDKCASVLRELTGPVAPNSGETRAEFIQRLVNEARVGAPMPPFNYGAFSVQPTVPPKGQLDGKIRFRSLLPKSDFTAADLTTPPASATNGRGNPNKDPGPAGPLNPYVASDSAALSIAAAINSMASPNFLQPQIGPTAPGPAK